jgi:ATP-dependent RNA helicase DHX29
MPQDLVLDDVSCTADPYSVVIAMTSISTPTSQQAESYVSVIALFLLFSHSPKESRVYTRLSHPWRDLWDELVEMKTESDYNANVATARNIREILHEHNHRLDEDVVFTRNFKRRANSPKESEVAGHSRKEYDPNELQAIWTARCSAPSFQKMLLGRQTLPVWKVKQEIL